MSPLLDVSDLRVSLPTPVGAVHVLRGIDLAVSSGERLGVVGGSGCGKSMTALAIMGLLPHGAQRSAYRLSLAGDDLTGRSERGMRNVRGRRIGMVFQDPGAALNPVQTIGQQLQSVWRRHFAGSGAQPRERAVALLERVGIRNAARRLGEYPHHLSGGLKQRVLIAMALMAKPALLLADEPTTALDVTVQARVLNMLRDIQRELGIGILLITHDLGVVAAAADRVAVIYAGEIVESGPVATVLTQPAHPYTRRLLACVPDFSGGARLGTIPGEVPRLIAVAECCSFAPRCALALAACQAAPVPLRMVAADHQARCLRSEDVMAGHS